MTCISYCCFHHWLQNPCAPFLHSFELLKLDHFLNLNYLIFFFTSFHYHILQEKNHFQCCLLVSLIFVLQILPLALLNLSPVKNPLIIFLLYGFSGLKNQKILFSGLESHTIA